MTPRLTANPDSDVTLAASSRESDCDSDYAELHKKLLTILANTSELAGRIHELQKMHEVSAVYLEDFSHPMELFTHPHKVYPT